MTLRRVSRRALLTGRAASPPPSDVLVRAHRQIMACRVEIVLPGELGSSLPIAAAALDEGDRLEHVMTIFRETSEMSVVNREAHLRPVNVSEELFDVLSAAAELTETTQGAFDITSGPLSRCWGFTRREGRMPAPLELDAARGRVGMHLVELDTETRAVSFRQPGVALNLGSIGKGFALDRMATFLAARGVPDALLSAGSSSIVARGSSPWRVDLRTAATGERLARLSLRNAAVGTSGAGNQFFIHEGRRYGHVIDPRTGWPAAGVLSASVITSSGASADALSTAFLIGGIALADRYCGDHPNVLAIITPDAEPRTPVLLGSCPGASVELS